MKCMTFGCDERAMVVWCTAQRWRPPTPLTRYSRIKLSVKFPNWRRYAKFWEPWPPKWLVFQPEKGPAPWGGRIGVWVPHSPACGALGEQLFELSFDSHGGLTYIHLLQDDNKILQFGEKEDWSPHARVSRIIDLLQ